MYSMVLMAALTTGIDMPDIGRRGGRGCHGCYGGGCYGSYYGGCYGGWGGGYGGCYGGYGGGWGGCYGGMGGGGYGRGYGGYVWGGQPVMGGYAYSSPMMYGNTLTPGWGNYNSPLVLGNGNFTNPVTTQSFYSGGGAQANEATIIVNLPAEATLTFDGQPTQSRSSRRVFHSPPLEPGKTYTYELAAEINRGGRPVQERRHVEVHAGRQSEVTMNFNNAGPNQNPAGLNPGNGDEDVPATRTRRTGQGTLPTPPRDR